METKQFPADINDFEFDPFAPDFDLNPHSTYSYLRNNAPVYFWAARNAWIFTRYHDVVAVIREPRLSTSYWLWEYTPPQPPEEARTAFDRLQASAIFFLSDADHLRLRKLINPVFAPSAMERMRGQVQEIVDDVIASFDGRERIDAIADLVKAIPLRTISRVLGIPREFEAEFRAFGETIILGVNPFMTPEQRAAITAEIPRGVELLGQIIEDRRRNPGSDILSALIQMEEQGDRLSRDELISLVTGLIGAGAETTIYLIAFAIYSLLKHPDQLTLLKSQPTLIRGAMEEVMRFDSPGKGVARFASEALELNGAKIHKGQMVVASLTSAMRDPDVFPNPDVFDIRRDQSNNIAYGHGPHYCVGRALARIEAQVAISTLLQTYPDLELAGEPTFSFHAFVRKMESLPLRLGARRS